MSTEADKPAVRTDAAKPALATPADAKTPEELSDDDLDNVTGGQRYSGGSHG